MAITSAFQADDAGSIPATRSRNRSSRIDAHIAQAVEHFLGKEEVTGSNPVMSTIAMRDTGHPALITRRKAKNAVFALLHFHRRCRRKCWHIHVPNPVDGILSVGALGQGKSVLLC